jgi:adenylate kinase family enzyme
MNTTKKIVNFVLGGPSSGKGTFCKNFCEIVQGVDACHFSAGELLRQFVIVIRW